MMLPQFRVFISSPGDVAEERKLAMEVIDQLSQRPSFRDRLTLRTIAWDKPGETIPILATLTPQEAINRGLPKPSDCDIVVVIFWSRMGTILPEEYKKPDGSRYWSGTEWEYLDAFNKAKTTGKPLLVVYRRVEKVMFDKEVSDFTTRLEQQQRVEAFFDSFVNSDGSLKQGYNPYEKPEDFQKQFASQLESLILQLTGESDAVRLSESREKRQADLYDLLAELKDARSKYIRFSRGERRGDPDEHERLISAAQKICARASRFDDKPCSTEALQMIIPSHASEQEFARFKAIDNDARNSLKYIADIWLTVNQVTKSHNFTEYRLWGEYEDRNISAFDHGIWRLSALINT